MINDTNKFIARPDFVYAQARLAIEAESYRYHAGKAAWEHDLARRNRLIGHGFDVVHVTARQIARRDPSVIELIRRKLEASHLF